jgi:hypothetical protein
MRNDKRSIEKKREESQDERQVMVALNYAFN